MTAEDIKGLFVVVFVLAVIVGFAWAWGTDRNPR